jgi:predicted outer membrane repeat protein
LAQVGGGIFVSGDVRRNYGLSGSPVIGTPSVNRAPVTIERTVFADCDVDSGGISGQGSGGAMSMSLVDLEVDGTLIIGSDAVGTGSSGGALRVTNESVLDVNTTTFAKNTAVLYGGAVFAAGTELDLNSCQLFANEISPGVSEPEGQSYGAAIFAAPIENAFPGFNLPVTGNVSSNTLSLNIGMPVFDDDRSPSPINAVRYNGNSFHNSTFSDRIYFHSMIGSHTVSQLNSLVVSHSGVDKATVNNQWSSSAPILGAIRAVPPKILPTSAPGDASTATTSYLGYAWSGGNATLNGNPVAGGIGYAAATEGNHTLNVDGQQFSASVGVGVAPNATLAANPQYITSGGSSTLSWSTTSGRFVGAFLDRGLGAVGTAAGNVIVSPTATTTYTIVVVTEEGGVVKTATVWVDEIPGAIFDDDFETGNTDRWDSVSP